PWLNGLIDDPGAAMKTVNKIFGNGAGCLVAILGIARPSIQVDDHRLAILAYDGIAAEDLHAKHGRRVAGNLLQSFWLEDVSGHALVSVIEPFEPGIGTAARHAIELD